MGAFAKRSLSVASIVASTCLLVSGCGAPAGPAAQMTFPKPVERVAVIRTMSPPSVPDPAGAITFTGPARERLMQARVTQTKEAVAADPDAWIEAMKPVHARFDGTPGYVALIGDSITVTDAFWTPLEFNDPAQYLSGADGLPRYPDGMKWKDVIKGTRGKGLEHCNGSGWQVNYVLRAIDAMLARQKPEVAIIMVGTNDVGPGYVAPGWQEQYEKIIAKCLAVNCIPILNTIPPRHNRDEPVAQINRIVRVVAARYKVPLVDYHAELTRRRPGDTCWGTLMQHDGLHPTAGKTNVFTDENLSDSGYALRNWMNFQAYRQVYFRVLHPEQVEPVKSAVR